MSSCALLRPCSTCPGGIQEWQWYHRPLTSTDAAIRYYTALVSFSPAPASSTIERPVRIAELAQYPFRSRQMFSMDVGTVAGGRRQLFIIRLWRQGHLARIPGLGEARFACRSRGSNPAASSSTCHPRLLDRVRMVDQDVPLIDHLVDDAFVL